MSTSRPSHALTGALGPVAFYTGAVLLAAAPLMRGGNRFVALLVLEVLALVVLAGWWSWRAWAPSGRAPLGLGKALVIASPILVAAVQLMPLPSQVWLALPGRDAFGPAMRAAGLDMDAWRPLSLMPEATIASALAALPIAACFMLGHEATLRQLRWLARVILALAFLQVLVGIGQIAGGIHSPLYFGMMSYGPAIGTFANRNLLGNYLALALVACLWLAYESHRARGRHSLSRALRDRHQLAIWGGAVFLIVLGILLTRSRGTLFFGSLSVVAAFAAIVLRIQGLSRGWRFLVPVVLIVLLLAGTAAGVETLQSRLTASEILSSASFRGELARTSFEAAAAFWPFGSGLGTYAQAYPRFQPPAVTGFANHAHQDYIEQLVEAGALFVIFGALFGWLALRRLAELTRRARSGMPLESDAMAAVVFGIGLAGFLGHSLIDFTMRVPANAMVAALFAGAFLRPLPAHGAAPASGWAPA